jgi:hypothetical protein
MTLTDIIPTSTEVIRLTRSAWQMNKAEFGRKLGLTGEYIGQVEHGKYTFSDDAIASGCSHADSDVRRFWQQYRTARHHELDAAILDKCFETNTTA